MENLESLRNRLNAIDLELIDVLRRRAETVKDIGAEKARQGIPAEPEDRKDRSGLVHIASGDIDGEFFGRLYALLGEHYSELEESSRAYFRDVPANRLGELEAPAFIQKMLSGSAKPA